MTHTIIYDGDCGFCQRTVDLINKVDWLHKFEFIPFQDPSVFKKYSQLTKEMCEREIFLVSPNRDYYSGYDAFKIMTLFLPVTILFSWFFFLPGITHTGRIIYRIIAANRHKIQIGGAACKVDKK